MSELLPLGELPADPMMDPMADPMAGMPEDPFAGVPDGPPDASGLLTGPPLGQPMGPMGPPSMGEMFQDLVAAPEGPDVAGLLTGDVGGRPSARDMFSNWKLEQFDMVDTEPGLGDVPEDRYLPTPAERAAEGQTGAASRWMDVSERAASIGMADSVEELAAVFLGKMSGSADQMFDREAGATIVLQRYEDAFGGDTPEWDWSVFDTVMGSKVSPSAGMNAEMVAVWNRFQSDPHLLSEIEVSRLLSSVNAVANIVDQAAAAGADLDPDTDVEQVVFTEEGPMLFTKSDFDFPANLEMVDPTAAMVQVTAPKGRSTVLLADGRAGLLGYPSYRNAAAFNGFTPVVTGVNDTASRWAKVQAAEVMSLQFVRQSASVADGSVIESMLNTDLKQFGGLHPGMQGRNTVMFTVPDGRAAVQSLGWSSIPVGRARMESSPPDEIGEVRQGHRYFVEVPDELTVADVAAEIEARGGVDVMVYATEFELEGWERHRQYFYTDGIETLSVITDVDTTVDPGSVYVFTRPAGMLPAKHPSTFPVRRVDDNHLLFADQIAVISPSAELTPTGGLLGVEADGRKVRRFGFMAEAGTFVPMLPGDETEYPVTVTKGDGGQFQVTAETPVGVDAAMVAGLLLRSAGGTPTVLSTPDWETTFQQQVSVQKP